MSTPLQSSNAAAIAAALWDSGDFAGADAAWQRALQEDAEDFEALHGLGRLRLAQNQLAGAAALLERARTLLAALDHGAAPELARRVQRDLAWAYYRLDRFDLAAPHFTATHQDEGLARQLAAFEGRTPYRMAASVEEIRLPFWGTDPLPIVPLRLGDQEFPFVIDTGSSQLVLDSSFLRELDLPRYGVREVTSASGLRTPIEHTILPEVVLDTVTITDVPAEVMDVRRFAPQIGGLIGTNFLQRFFVDCDWSEETLTLRPIRQQAPFEHWQQSVPAEFYYLDSHLLLSPARLNDLSTMAYLASGMAGASFTLATHTALQAELHNGEAQMDAISAAGAQALALATATRLCVGEHCMEEQEGLTGLFPDELAWRYGFHVGAMVGHDFFKQRRWGIDFAAMRLYFASETGE